MLRLPVFLLFVPYSIDSKATVFTNLFTTLWASVNYILEPVHYKGYPHTTVTLKYAQTGRGPVGIFSRFETGTSDNFFMAIWTCNVHWNIFESGFGVRGFRAICTCLFSRLLAFTRFLRDQMYPFFVGHVLKSNLRTTSFSEENAG